MVFTKLTSGVWGATKKAFSWADRKLGKGADFIDEQWRTKAQPALESTFGRRVMDLMADASGNFVGSSLVPARAILDGAVPLLEALPQGNTIKSITEAVRYTKNYADNFANMTRNYISPKSVERKTLKPPSTKPQVSNPYPKQRIRTQKMNSGRLKLTENHWIPSFYGGSFG